MSEWDLPPLDGDIRALVRRAATVEPASPGARARVLAGVEAIVGPSGGDGGGCRPDAHADVPPPSTSSRPTSALRRALPLATTFALGCAMGAAVMYAATRTPAPVETPRVVYVERPVATAIVDAAPLEPTASAAQRPPAPPSTAPSLAQSPARWVVAPDQLAAERVLLDVARNAIEKEDGAAALAAAAQHDRKYPNGILVQEREAIVVRALVLLGRTAEARVRAERFRTRFPNSLLLPTIESAVGAPAQ